jgi:hypothetical protein
MRLVEEEAKMLFDARVELLEGELDQSEFDEQNYLFNLHKNMFLSGTILMKQAEIAKERKAEGHGDELINVVKVSSENDQNSENSED